MRIVGLDATRSLAILLAMSSHVYADVGLGTHMPSEIDLPLRIMFQVSTPVFVLIFGAMLEVVYLPRFISGSKRSISSRLVFRALQCWFLYAVSIFTLFIFDNGYSLSFSISCLLFMGNSPYTEILKFYAVALAVAPLLLWIRVRIGLAPLILAAATYQAAWPILHSLPDAQHDLGIPLQVARFLKFVTGFGSPQLAGPSVLHGLTLVIAGQTFGKVVLGWGYKPMGRQDLALASSNFGRGISMLLILTSGLASMGAFIIPREVLVGLADMSLRMNSHVLYFIIGAVSAVLVSLAFIWMIDVRKMVSSRFWFMLSFFGRTSMFTFAWGNIMLYMVNYYPAGKGDTYTIAFLLVAAICLMSFVFDFVMRHSEIARAVIAAMNKPLDDLARLLFSMVSGKRSSSESSTTTGF